MSGLGSFAGGDKEWAIPCRMFQQMAAFRHETPDTHKVR